MSVERAVSQTNKLITEELKNIRNELFPKMKKLIEEIKLFAWCLQENLIDTFVKYTTTKNLEQLNYRNRKQKIITEYDNLIKEVENFRMKTDSDVEFQNLVQKQVSSFDNLQNLFTAVEGETVLSKAEHEFARYKYADAMSIVLELRKKLKNITFEGNCAKALANLLVQAETQFSIYTAKVSVEWEELFHWSEKKGTSYLTYSLYVQQSCMVMLQNVLKSLYVSNRFNMELAPFSKFFIDNMLHNIIRYNCDIFTEEVANDTIVFNVRIDMDDKTIPNFQTVFNNITTVLDFLHSTLGVKIEDQKDFIPIFANSIKNKFFDKIIEDCVRSNLPTCDSSYEQYKSLVIELDSFNKFLIDLKFVDKENSPLNKFVEDTECVLYNKKCDKLLSDVRDLLSQSLSYGTILVGTDNFNEKVVDITEKTHWNLKEPLLLPKCIVSENVKKILDLIVEHLVESTKLPEKYGIQLVSYIRSVCVLYQSIVPMKFNVNLECCPLDIALFFNNCFYLAHGLIGPPWKRILSPTFSDYVTTMMLDCIQDFRLLGLEKLSLYLEKRKKEIIKSILPDELPPWSEDSYESFDSAVNSALVLLRDLKTCWFNVLPNRMYELSMCALIQGVCQASLDRVFADTRPIDEKIVYLIAHRYNLIRTQAQQLFQEPINLDARIDNWRKLVLMPQLLKAQMLEMTELWKNETDVHSSFKCDEIRQIVKIRFPDDKFRLKTLIEIQ